MNSTRHAGGFTLIELLVVMAIIATLAGLSIMGIPAILRQADITADKGKLQAIYKQLLIYQTNHKAMSPRSGPAFVLSIWDSGLMDKTQKDAEIFFAATTGNEPYPDLGNVSPEGIDWTGPDQEGARQRMKTQNRNANNKVIVCNKVPAVQTDADLDEMPYAAKGICYLLLGGNVDFMDSSSWPDGYPVIGPESALEMFEKMVPQDIAEIEDYIDER
jgi:prepilin-type N-terminal cleavage/methylation domain-containing protein